MRKFALLVGAALTVGQAAPGLAAEAPARNAVLVTFKEPVGDRFLGLFHTIMGTATLKKYDASRYAIRIGDRGNQNDYAVLFAHLPYVAGVEPIPRLTAAERKPPAAVALIAPKPQAPRGYVPGQLLVKPKPGADASALAALDAELGASIKERIDGIDVLVMALPEGLAVSDAQRRYLDSGLVTYAEPNRTMTLPPQPSPDPAPSDNAGPGIYLSPDRLLGEHLFVRYRVGGPMPELVNQIYGTKTLERTSADALRITLPAHVNPLLAQHMFRLCPYVSAAEPSYGR